MSLNDLAATGVVLLVDHQHGPAERATSADAKTVDKNAAKLVKAAQVNGMPVVLSGIGTMGEPKLTHELRDALGDGATIHQRMGTDSMGDVVIEGAISATGRRTLLVAGIVTEIAVQRAALSAKERGYDVRVVLDACNGYSERSEWAAVERMTQAGIVMTSVPAILGELMVDFNAPTTKDTIPLLMG